MRAALVLISFALFKFTAHMLTAGGYGYFRDELYYLACANHLDFGYVDHPPLSIAVLWITRAVLGNSLWAIRLPAAASGAATVMLTGMMARALNGGLFAPSLAMTAVIVAPVFLAVDSFYSMNSFDVLFWTAAAYQVMRVLQTGRPRHWVLLGMVMGLGLLNKISMLWFGAGLAVGLLLTPSRRLLLTPWPWIAGTIAGWSLLPYILWQVVHGWPTLEFMRKATATKMLATSPLEFLAEQVLVVHPLNAVLWLAGLAYYLFLPAGRAFRPLGWIYVAVFLLLALSGTSRVNYLAPAYPMLFAAGAVSLATVAREGSWQWLRPVSLVSLFAGGLVTAPLAFPLLPVESYIAYARAVGIKTPREERHAMGALPQHFADRHGWEEIVRTIAAVYHRLSPQERLKAGIFVSNYGEAGAVDLLGKMYGLPPAISGHNNYWLWGPGPYSGEVMIVLAPSPEPLEEVFEQVEEAARVRCGYCMPYENKQRVYICRRAKRPLGDIWAGLKSYI